MAVSIGKHVLFFILNLWSLPVQPIYRVPVYSTNEQVTFSEYLAIIMITDTSVEVNILNLLAGKCSIENQQKCKSR